MPKQPRDEDRIKNMVISGMQAEMETGGLDMVVSVLKDGDGKQCTVQEIREIETQLVLSWRLKEKISEKEIKDRLRIYRQGMGLPFETPQEKQSKIVMAEIRDWVQVVAHGNFAIRDIYNYFPQYSKSTNDKKYLSTCIARLVKEHLLERDGRYGQYRKCELEIERMDFLSVEAKALDIWLPLELGNLVELYPGNIVVISGEKGSGKTTLAMNIAWENRNTWDVNYYNSEMGKAELKKRVLMFEDTEPYEWAEKISFYPRAENFHDVLQIGDNKLNLIDYLEVSGDDYPQVSRWILDIHRAIIQSNTLVIICLQKPPGRDEAYGGTPTRDKPRLYLSVSRGKIKIVDAKNWVTSENPTGYLCDFKIINGHKLIQSSPWGREDRFTL